MEAAKENILKYASGNQEDNYCRLCFVKAFKLRNVFPYGDNPNNELFRKIFDLAMVRLNHLVEPDCCICSRCVTSLEEFEKFQRQCEEYNRLLLEARGQLAPQQDSKKPAKNFVAVSIPNADNDALTKKGPNKRKKNETDDDVDPFEAFRQQDDNVSETESEHTRKPVRSSRRTANYTSRKRGQRALRRPKDESESNDGDGDWKQESDDSDDSFKPTRSRSRKSKIDDFAATTKKRTRRSKEEMLQARQSGTECDRRKRRKIHSSSDFTVYDAGHGSINIVSRGFRYFKYRYYKTGSEVRYGWQCIERDCAAQITTSSKTKGIIFWRENFQNHDHPVDNLEELVAAKMEDAEQGAGGEEEANEAEVLSSGRGRHNYSLVKLGSGEEVLVYGDHRHRLLIKRADDTKIYGCTVSSCRALIYFSKDNEMKIYSGSCTTAEEAAERSYRKSHKILAFEGHYYAFSGRKLENKCLVWHCYLRKSHSCPTIIYATEEDEVIGTKHQIKLPHSHDTEAYKLEEGVMVVEGQKGYLPVESSNYHVAKNQIGTDFIIFEGLRYSIINTKVDGTRACRCLETDTCGAYIYLIPNGTVVKFSSGNEHSHPLPEQEKSIHEFDYVIETEHVEKGGQLFKWHKGFEYKRVCRRDNFTLYYRCSEKRKGCLAAFTCNNDFSLVRENPEPHCHEMPQVEQERRKTLLEVEGTKEYTMEVNGDGHDVLNYRDNRYCHFYNHKDGWRVWRCFSSCRCRATLFQSLPDGSVIDVEKFQHKHSGSKNREEDEEKVAVKEDQRNFSDSDSRESADWF